jgi:hypothetical protein
VAVTFVANGSAVNTTTTTLTLVAPSLVGGDLLIAVINTHDNTAVSGQNSRWQTLYAANNTSAQRFTIFWMLALVGDSGASFNFTVAGTTAALGQLSAYRGARAVGASSSSANASSATVTWATLTPNQNDSVILAAAGIGIQTGSDGGISAGTPTFALEYYSAGTTDAIALYDALTPQGTATGARTMNNTQAAVNTGVFFELIPSIVSSTQGSGGGGGRVNARSRGTYGNRGAGFPRYRVKDAPRQTR